MLVAILFVLLLAAGAWTFMRIWRGDVAGVFSGVGAILVVAALSLLTGCGDHITNVNLDLDQTQAPPAPAPTIAPSASPSSGGAVAAVTINGFHEGENCPAGIAKANAEKSVRAGCTLDVTVNPRRADGTVIRDTNITGLVPDYFRRVDSSGAGTFVQDSGNQYNGRIAAAAAGTIVLEASVKGVPTPPGGVTFTVVP
jgi:hypothetical protein